MKRESWQTNRDTVKQPRSDRSTWCVCDRSLVQDGGKCRVCGCNYNGKSYRYHVRDFRAPQQEE